MATASGLGLSELARLGFSDLAGTIAKLDKLVSLVGDSGRSALAPLAEAANPDQALNALIEFAEIDKASIKPLLKNSESARRICLTFGASSAMVDLVRRQPSMLSVFDKAEAKLPGAGDLTQRFQAALHACSSPISTEKAWPALRLVYRRELLRLAAFDVSHAHPQDAFSQVSAHLSDLAGAALDAGLEVARRELAEGHEHGVFSKNELADTALAVIAMGKCGARELNYISDVDVIYVAESTNDRTDTSRALEIATRLATRMMRAMDGSASEPALWQVDPNLRPEGKSGALVRTLESHVAYYQRWAENWEFQALLKARPVAGDLNLGARYVDSLEPMVWASAQREGFVESAQRMRERVTAHIPAAELDSQIKLGPGGLRDVEFTVQLLQLVHGRNDETIRKRDTLGAIAALMDAGYLSRTDASVFSSHYRFLRLLEHRIQLAQMRRTHLMPSSEESRRTLARAMGLRTADELIERWESIKLEVRSLHQKVFYRPLLSAVAKLDSGDLEMSSEQAEDRLRAIGFLDPKNALAQIRALTGGLTRRAAIQKQLLPVLLQWFGDGGEPDAALLAFRRLSEDLGESPWYLRMLRDSSGAAERLTNVLSLSRLATELFERLPEGAAWLERVEELSPKSFEQLESETLAITSRHEDIEKASGALKQLRRRETLRVAMGAVLGELSLQQIEHALTDIAKVYIEGYLGLITDEKHLDLGKTKVTDILEFAVIAMGRFGGGELGFGSDADVMFVYRSVQADNQEAHRVAERIVSELRRLSADSALEFELDLDLRPEGKNGPIVRSFDAYEQYYKRWASTWESQALLRAAPIAGDAKLVSDFVELIDRYRYPQSLDASAITEIRRIKARVETERLPQGADPKRHLKLGRGSISDVEWLVQLMQLRFGSKHPEIQTPKTLDALNACVSAGLIEAHDARVLEEAWLLASRVRSASVLWANKRTDVLPNDRRQLEGLARILEYPKGSASALEQDYLAYTRRARTVFERLFFAD